MTTKVRMVHLQLANGATAIGVVPAVFTDQELSDPGGVSVAFSDVYDLPSQISVETLLQHLAAAAIRLVH